MLEEKIDVGDTDEQEMTIDLDAPAPEQSLEEDIQVEQVEEASPAEEAEQPEQKTEDAKKELNEYSDGVQKRIAKLTRKMREAERQKEEAIQYAKSMQDQATKIKQGYDTLGNNYTSELEAKVTQGMAAAKSKLKEAIANQDVDGQIEAQRSISQMSMEEARLAQIKQYQAQRAEQAKIQAQTPQQNYAQMAQSMPTQEDIYQAAQQIDPKAQTWAEKNKWFGTDNAMTYTAFDIHRQLVEEEGYDPQSGEYYSEVDKRIRVAFPQKFDKTEDTSVEAPAQTVASAKRPAAKGRRKTVKLTPSQVAISKRLGVPLEEYAKQLAAKEV